jgi:hypothetical protein
MQNNVNSGKSHEKYWRLSQEPKPNGGNIPKTVKPSAASITMAFTKNTV